MESDSWGSIAERTTIPAGCEASSEWNNSTPGLAATDTISSISQTGATWVLVKAKTGVAIDSEIWAAYNVQSAGTTITVNVTAITTVAIANVYEYAAPNTISLDLTASNSGTTSPSDTGTTGTISQAQEVLVGCIAAAATGSQSAPTNGFTLIDGAVTSAVGSNAFLELIVAATQTANSGTTLGGVTTDWAGCMATFKSVAAVIVTGSRRFPAAGLGNFF